MMEYERIYDVTPLRKIYGYDTMDEAFLDDDSGDYHSNNKFKENVLKLKDVLPWTGEAIEQILLYKNITRETIDELDWLKDNGCPLLSSKYNKTIKNKIQRMKENRNELNSNDILIWNWLKENNFPLKKSNNFL